MALQPNKIKNVFKNQKNQKTEIPIKKLPLTLNYYFTSHKLGQKLISYFIRSGKKQLARNLMYTVCVSLNKNVPEIPPTMLIKQAIINSLPFYETRSYKKRGQTVLATLPVYTKQRRLFLLFKYIKIYLKTLHSQNYTIKCTQLLIQLYNKQGPFFNALQKTYKTTIQQYPQLHFRWK